MHVYVCIYTLLIKNHNNICIIIVFSAGRVMSLWDTWRQGTVCGCTVVPFTVNAALVSLRVRLYSIFQYSEWYSQCVYQTFFLFNRQMAPLKPHVAIMKWCYERDGFDLDSFEVHKAVYGGGLLSDNRLWGLLIALIAILPDDVTRLLSNYLNNKNIFKEEYFPNTLWSIFFWVALFFLHYCCFIKAYMYIMRK